MFSVSRQRTALTALAKNPHEFLRSNEGQAFAVELGEIMTPRVAAAARGIGLGSHWYERTEVVNTALVRLCAEDARVAKLAARAEIEPWRYLVPCMITWMREQWGTRGEPLDACLTLAARAGSVGVADALSDAVRHTFTSVAFGVPSALRRDLHLLLQWLARNPPQRRSYEAADREEARRRFSRFTTKQIAAATSLVWGSRPKAQQTSLVAAFLLDDEFRPFESVTHARTIMQFTRAMREPRLSAVSSGFAA